MSYSQNYKGHATTPPRKLEAKLRLAYLVTHPIQYQAPLLRRIAKEPDIDLTVFFGSDFSVRGYSDKGFGVDVRWDTPLVEGYHHEFLPALRDSEGTGPLTPLNYGITRRLCSANGTPAFDALWVHGYSTINAWHAMIAAKALEIPVLLRAESWLMKESEAKRASKHAFFGLLRELVAAVLPIGTRNREFWQYYFGRSFPMFTMPYAVDNMFFQQKSLEAQRESDRLRRTLGLEPARPVILFASKLQSRKRCVDLLDAYRNLSPSSQIEPHPYLVIVGEGEERQFLEEQTQQTGWNSIRFCGFRNQSEMPAFFDLATVFVLPSFREAWGLVVNEAMNAGKAIIVSDEVGCQPDLVHDGVEGCVFRAGDVSALNLSLHRVLDQPDTAAAMGKRALDRIRQWGLEESVCGLREALDAVTGKIAT